MTSFRAIPTEYKGILYRSKSEAMFARYLELSTSCNDYFEAYKEGNVFGRGAGFIYKPRGICTDHWHADFLTWELSPLSGILGTQVPVAHYEIIDYKPDVPTKAFLKRFQNNATEISRVFVERGAEEFAYRSSWSVYFGSVYTKKRGVLTCIPLSVESDLQDRDDDWLALYEDEVSSTRFDLVHPCW